MDEVRRVLAEELDIRFSYPSAPAELHHSTRCLLYDDDEEPGGAVPIQREVVVKACPIEHEAALLSLLGQLYESECPVVDVPLAPPQEQQRQQQRGPPRWRRALAACRTLLPRHPGLLPLIAVLRTPQRLYVVSGYHPHSLLALLHFSSQALLESSLLGRMSRESVLDLRLLFIFYELVRALAFYHGKGRALGNLSMRSVYVNDMVWLRLVPGLIGLGPVPALPSPSRPPGYDTPLTLRWVKGQVSNFEYLMALNAAAGRSLLDPTFHAVMPWVSDLKTPQGGWRDLTKSKFRLAKGDEQLDWTYRHSSPPHHIPESLSEISFYIYMARRTPLAVLRAVVRADFVPQQYPATVARLYEWSPDECTPEFYTDASIFTSLHAAAGLPDLGLPAWCATPADFISYHRGLLESEEVSARLHHWIDLTFGHALEGAAALQNKNVPLRADASTAAAAAAGGSSSGAAGGRRHRLLLAKSPGFVQLFREPHPRRGSLEGGLKTLTRRDLRQPAGAASSAPLGAPTFIMAVEGVDVRGDEREMLRRAPTIPLDGLGARRLHHCVEALESLQAVGGFAHKVERRLEPSYGMPAPPPSLSSAGDAGPMDDVWLQQKSDMFAAGCILAELYLGKPVLSLHDVAQRQQREAAAAVAAALAARRRRGRSVDLAGPDAAEEAGGEQQQPQVPLSGMGEEDDPFAWLPGETAHLPYPVRRLLHRLLQRDPRRRPRAASLVDAGDGEEDGDGAGGDGGEEDEEGLVKEDAFFPPFFGDLYRYLALVHAQREDASFEGISVTLSLARQLVELPLPAFALVLPYLLQALEDPAPYEEYARRQQEQQQHDDGIGEEAPVILRIVPFIDLLGLKLGSRHTQRLVFPRVAALLERLTDRRLLRALFVSPLWATLVRRGGTAGFVAHVLPFMLRMLRHYVPLEVQQAAYVAVFNLGSPEILGAGLVARYVIPSLLDNVGRLPPPPEEEGDEASGSNGSSSSSLEWGEDLYQARALLSSCSQIGDDLLSALVAEHLLMDVIPSLERTWLPEPADAAALALLEALAVLEGLLPTLSPTSALFHYCKQPSLPVQQLLLALPLPPPPDGDGGEQEEEDATQPALCPLVPQSPRHRLHAQLCRLVGALALCIGSRRTEELLLPAVNTFLGGFTDLYDDEASAEGDDDPAQGPTWRMAAYEMVEDLWRGLEGLYDDAALARLVPNGSKLVAPWYRKANSGSDGRGGGCAGRRHFLQYSPDKAAHSPTGPRGFAWAFGGGRDGGGRRGGGGAGVGLPGERERLTDLVIEKGLSGLMWIAKQGRQRFQRATAPGGPDGAGAAGGEARSPTASTVSMSSTTSGSLVALAARREESGGSRATRGQVDVEETEDEGEEPEEEDEEAQSPRRTRRISTAGKEVLLPVSPTAALATGHVGGGGHMAADTTGGGASDDEGEESGGEEGEDGGRGGSSKEKDKLQQQQPAPSAAPSAAPAGPVRATVGAAAEGRSAKREEWFAANGVQGRVTRDHVWLLGPLIDPPSLHAPAALPAAGGSWPMHMCVQAALEAYKSGSSVRSLAVDPAETLLLSGSRRGVVNVWSLRDFPVAQQLSGMEHLHSESVFSLAFMNGGEQALSLDSSLCVWDVATGAVLARKERYAAEIGGMPFCYMAAEALPAWGGVGLGSSSRGHQLLAATQTTLYHYDLRDRASGSGGGGGGGGGASQTMLAAAQLSEWGVSSSCFTDRGIGAALQCLATHEDGYWVCTGSSNGQMCVLDRRTGEIAQAWQAHEGPIVKIFPWGRDKVLSVSMDRTAVLWDIRSTIPRDLCCLRGLPDAQSATTVIAKEFRRTPSGGDGAGGGFPSSAAPSASGAAAGKRPHVLLSFGGYKGVIARMPRPGMDVVARTRHFLGPNGLKLKQKINVQSAALLPLRNLLLVGCDDGLIRVCT